MFVAPRRLSDPLQMSGRGQRDIHGVDSFVVQQCLVVSVQRDRCIQPVGSGVLSGPAKIIDINRFMVYTSLYLLVYLCISLDAMATSLQRPFVSWMALMFFWAMFAHPKIPKLTQSDVSDILMIDVVILTPM